MELESWMDGCKSHLKNRLQQSTNTISGFRVLEIFKGLVLGNEEREVERERDRKHEMQILQ